MLDTRTQCKLTWSHLLLLDGLLAVLEGKATVPREAARKCQGGSGKGECKGRRELHLGQEFSEDSEYAIGVATCGCAGERSCLCDEKVSQTVVSRDTRSEQERKRPAPQT